MKEQIDKLVELAREYCEYGIEMKFPLDSTYLREITGKEGDEIRVYFANDYDTRAVTLGGVFGIDVSFYTGRISIPIKYDAKKLEETHDDAREYLDWLKSEGEKEFKAKLERERAERIEELKKELALLEGV